MAVSRIRKIKSKKVIYETINYQKMSRGDGFSRGAACAFLLPEGGARDGSGCQC